MVGDLRLDMERALEDMRTQVFPHLREGTIPSDLEKDGYRGLFMETTLQDQGEVDVMVELEREGFRKIFLDRLSEIVYMRLGEILTDHPPGKTRRQELQKELTDCLNNNFELFWGALEAVIRKGIPSTDKFVLDYLDCNEDLALAFINAARKSKHSPENVRQLIEDQCSLHTRTPVGNFRGASIPNPVALFGEFGRICDRLNSSHSENVFGTLMTALQELGREATGGEQELFFSPGARKGWLAAFNALQKSYPTLRVYGSPHEYLAMLQDRDNCRVVAGGIEEKEGELDLSKNILDSIAGESGLVGQPVVFLSSVRRTGKRVDINRIMKEIRAEAPDVIFVVDAAQDHYMYPGADIVLYSKRFGGTGTGLVMIKKDTIHPKVRQAMAVQEGVNTQLLAATVAGLRCERQKVHFANKLQELVQTPEIWSFKNGGSYIKKQADKIVGAVSADAVLGDHFVPCYDPEEADEANPRLWKSSRIITLHQRPSSGINLQKLAEIVEQQGIHLDWISPELEPEFEQYLIHMGELPYSRDNCRCFCDALLEFQTVTKPTYFSEMIVLPEVFNGTAPMSEELYERQRAYLKESLSRQNMIRLYIDIQMNNEDIEKMLSALIYAASVLTAFD
jgi:hypothetical protein